MNSPRTRVQAALLALCALSVGMACASRSRFVTTALANGTVIYSSRVKGTPVTFLLGGDRVIAGVDEGVTGMKVGEHRRLVVPPSLYRRSTYPANTPKEATLFIDVELLELPAE